MRPYRHLTKLEAFAVRGAHGTDQLLAIVNSIRRGAEKLAG
jgi:hypothetical protein